MDNSKYLIILKLKKLFERKEFIVKTMFNSTLQNILRRQNYIDQLSDQQISTIQTKELFFKALEESSNIDPFSDNEDFQQKMFRSPNMDDPATNLLKHILPAPQNSYQQIQQLQSKIKLFSDKKLNQAEMIREMFQQDKDQIKQSGLKVSDFMDIYEGDDMEQQNKDLNDPLVKKIMAYFQANTKQYSLYQLLNAIVQGISVPQIPIEEQHPPIKAMRQIRQSVCSLQGFNIRLNDEQSQFNEQTKKQMDKILSYYQGILQIFDVQTQN